MEIMPELSLKIQLITNIVAIFYFSKKDLGKVEGRLNGIRF